MKTLTSHEVLEARLFQALKGDWDHALHSLCEAFSGNTAHFTLLHANDATAGAVYAVGWDPKLLRRAAALHSTDPRTQPGLSESGLNRPHHCREVVTTKMLHQSRMYREVLAPANVEYCLRVYLGDEGATGLLAVTRDRNSEPFDEADVDRLRNLVPTLRAIANAERGRVSRIIALEVQDEALTRAQVALFLARADGTIVESNAYGRHLLELGRPVRSAGSTLVGSNGAVHETLLGLLAGAGTGGDPLTAPNPHHCDWASAFDGRHHWRVCAYPVPIDQAITGSTALNTLIALTLIPDRRLFASGSVEQFAARFGLTDRQCEVLNHLARGHDAREISRALKLKTGTVRDHLKAIFRRTQTHSQLELLRKIADESNASG